MGLTGSGWSTTIARVYIARCLLGAVLWEEREAGNATSHGLAAGMGSASGVVLAGSAGGAANSFEGGVFGVVTVLAARLDEISLAAHSMAVNVISITYMVPLGISSAAAVRVGHAVGRGMRMESRCGLDGAAAQRSFHGRHGPGTGAFAAAGSPGFIHATLP